MPIEKLIKGIHTFQEGFFSRNRELFQNLAEKGQKPDTLFITCCDSRVMPNLVTGAGPGELFIVRNVGNIVPHPELAGGNAAAIEYAVEVLGVANIIICGHTQCGAVNAILDPDSMNSLPFVRKWLAQAQHVRRLIEERYSDLAPDARHTVAVQENVLGQLENLREYPFVARQLDAGKLHLSAWVFDLGSGEVFDYDPADDEFKPLISRA